MNEMRVNKRLQFTLQAKMFVISLYNQIKKNDNCICIISHLFTLEINNVSTSSHARAIKDNVAKRPDITFYFAISDRPIKFLL